MTGSSSKTTSDETQNSAKDFVLKHRLIGAAILISFGVLFLPWVLGSYSVDKSDAVAGDDTPSTLTTANPTAFQAVDSQGDIQVFVSKIKPVKVDVPGSNKDKIVAMPSTTDEVQGTPAKQTAAKPQPKADPKPAKQVAKLDSSPATTPAKSEPQKATPTAAKTPADSAAIKQGYIVSVGVFSERKNVDAVVKDLRSKEFTPSSGVVKTKKGDATRVWLGPFATRAEAGRAKSRLQQKVGERGLIIKYP